MQPTVPDQLRRVQERIQDAARRTGRNPQDITLVAVTKTVPFDKVVPFIQAGCEHLAENRVQEALSKYFDDAGRRKMKGSLHLIGPLQSNKAKKAVGAFDMVQSVDRWAIAEDLERHARTAGKTFPCLLEVKLSPEETKSGLPPEEVDELLSRLRSLRSLVVKGLMGIPPRAAIGEKARPYFASLYRIWEKAKLDILSMGMSSDFESAIAEGSTMVRIGSALFGERH